MSVHVQLTLSLLKGHYALCRLDPYAGVPTWAARGEFWSVTRNPDQVSVVCPAEAVPAGVTCEPGWRTFQLEGEYSFSETGILDSAVEPLSHAGVAILVVSAYHTNYILVKHEQVDQAAAAMIGAGHTVQHWSSETSSDNGHDQPR